MNEITNVLTTLAGILGLSFGAIQTKRKSELDKILAASEGESKAIETATSLINTLNNQYDRVVTRCDEQEHLIDKMRTRLEEVEKEIEECRTDRQILIRIVQDNDIVVREDDARRLGLFKNEEYSNVKD